MILSHVLVCSVHLYMSTKQYVKQPSVSVNYTVYLIFSSTWHKIYHVLLMQCTAYV